MISSCFHQNIDWVRPSPVYDKHIIQAYYSSTKKYENNIYFQNKCMKSFKCNYNEHESDCKLPIILFAVHVNIFLNRKDIQNNI